jgi:hypothetical protein
MVTAKDIKTAYDEFEKAAVSRSKIETARLKAEDTQNEAIEAVNEARENWIDDQEPDQLGLKEQRKMRKAVRKEEDARKKAVKEFRVARIDSQKANDEYNRAGMRVDSLVKQLDAEKFASQKEN